jgi:hypothetical protein
MIDELLRGLSIPCRLVYSGTKFTACPNCKINTITGKSANTYRSGGPIPFSKGTCPFCSGEGKIAAENDDDTVNLAVIWDYKKWLQIGYVGSPEGKVQIICPLGLISRIKKASEIIVNTQLEKFVRHRFIREGEPTPIGFGDDQYIVTMWKRSG